MAAASGSTIANPQRPGAGDTAWAPKSPNAASPARGRIPNNLTPKQRMSRKLQTVKGKADYARRKAVVEPVFGQMKVAQHAGQFRLRGTDKTDGEWALHTFCHNLRKLQNAGWTAQMVT